MQKLVFVPILILAGLLLAIPAVAQNIDSLKLSLKKARPDTNKVNLLNELSYQSYRIGDFEAEMDYAKKALALAKKLKWEKGIANAYKNIGGAWQDLGKYNEAIDGYSSALKLFEELKNKEGIGALHSNIGGVFFEQGNFAEAIKHYYRALELDEELKNKNGVSDCYLSIGLAQDSQGNDDEALKCFFAALEIKKEIKEYSGLGNAYVNIGIVYYNQKNFEKALQFYYDAIEIKKSIGDTYGISNIYVNIGSVYHKSRDYENALKNYFIGMKLKEADRNPRGMAASYLNIGQVYSELKRFAEARDYLSRGLKISLELGAKENLTKGYSYLAGLDSLQGRWKNSLENYKTYILYRDSINSEENTKKTVQVQMQYEFDKKHAADSIKNAERTNLEHQKHETEIKQQRLYTYGGIIGFVLMLVVAIVSFRAFRNKQKANHIIAHQKLLVEDKQREILDSIHYAKRIQSALLPNEKYIAKQMLKQRC